MSSITVSQLNNQVKTLLETTFLSVNIYGEISNLTNHRSGHSYFVLKDEFSYIKCVLFKGNKAYIKMALEEGQKVQIKGAMTVYSPRGEYQIICKSIEHYGKGDLYIEYEALKKELQAKGFFDPSTKKPLPKFINEMVIITSASGAVIEDIKNVAAKRWPLVKIKLIDTLVQGAKASKEIAEAIQHAHLHTPDVIVLARGGGSIEDLWGFNERIVAEAIFDATIPIVSAIGHESDFLISDFVADKRAPTPSAAMEILLPDKDEYGQYLDDLRGQTQQYTANILAMKQEQMDNVRRYSKGFIIQNQFDNIAYNIKELATSFKYQLSHIIHNKKQSIPNIEHLYRQIIGNKITQYEQTLKQYELLFSEHNPQKAPSKGKAKILKNETITTLKNIRINDVFSLEDTDCIIDAKAIDKKEINTYE